MKVNILLSAYNGEKYIEAQLKSLLYQSYNNTEIHIRDDGSKDTTVTIIERYIELFPGKIFLYKGKNVGYKKSFQWLLSNCGDADFFAFCDQDDIWSKDKIKNAVDRLKQYDNSLPNLYLCNFYWCDKDMNLIRKNDAYKLHHSLEKYITFGDRNEFGCTEVFNKVVIDIIKNKACFDICSHDEIVYMICKCNGNVFWDYKIGVHYRRHGANSSKHELVGGNKWSHFLWRVNEFIIHPNKKALYERIYAFYDSFKEELSEDNRKIFELYLSNKGRLKKALLKERYRDTFFDEISIRILFILGKV